MENPMEEIITGVNEVIETDVQAAVEQDPSTETFEETVEKFDSDVQQTSDTSGDDDHTKVKKKDTNVAFSKRLAAERAKFEKDPLYQLGKMYAEQYEGNAENALNALISSRADELAQDPRKLAEHVLRANTQARTADVQSERVAEISQLMDEGILPTSREEFNALVNSDPEFSANVEEFGMRVAAKMARRVYDLKRESEQKIVERLSQNRQLPKSTRPNSNVAPAPIDPFSRTAAEHAEWREKMRRSVGR